MPYGKLFFRVWKLSICLALSRSHLPLCFEILSYVIKIMFSGIICVICGFICNFAAKIVGLWKRNVLRCESCWRQWRRRSSESLTVSCWTTCRCWQAIRTGIASSMHCTVRPVPMRTTSKKKKRCHQNDISFLSLERLIIQQRQQDDASP